MKAMKAKATMKAMKGAKLMSKGALATELSEASGLKKGEISTILDTLAEIGTKEVKKNGKFTLPGLCMIKTRKKKATKGGKKMMFGKEVKVKPQPAKTVVKAFPVAALKQQIWSCGLKAQLQSTTGGILGTGCPECGDWALILWYLYICCIYCSLSILESRCIQSRWACKLPACTFDRPTNWWQQKKSVVRNDAV